MLKLHEQRHANFTPLNSFYNIIHGHVLWGNNNNKKKNNFSSCNKTFE